MVYIALTVFPDVSRNSDPKDVGDATFCDIIVIILQKVIYSHQTPHHTSDYTFYYTRRHAQHQTDALSALFA